MKIQDLISTDRHAIITPMATEKEDDNDLLTRALGEVMRVVEVDIPKDDPEWIALVRLKLDAAKQLVPLLERRAALLGLDAPKQESKSPNQSGTLAELEQKLAMVARARQGGSS